MQAVHPIRFPGRKDTALVCLALLLAAATCHARVFLRWGAASQSTRALRELGGKIVYEAPVTINGGHGDLVIFNFDRSPGELMPRMRSIFGLKNFGFAGGNTAVANVRSSAIVIRLIALRLNNPGQTLVFKVEQSEDEYKSSQSPPEDHPTTPIPPYPGSKPEFYVRDGNTEASLAISTADSAPGTVRDFFRARLTASGWTPALAPAQADRHLLRDQSMSVYLKDRQMCCVMVTAEVAGTSRITLLHKTQGMK